MLCSYNELINFLTSRQNISDFKYKLIKKKIYSVITIPDTKYHISIFQDQWNNYESISNKPYYLFHISSNNEIDRCSSYFWVDKFDLKIKKIPNTYFKYNQPMYDFFSSTRNNCDYNKIKYILTQFQKMLNTYKNQ